MDINLIERGESFYQKHMEALVKELDEKGLLEEDEGRKVMWGKRDNEIPLTVVKSDGAFTYDTSDLAALKQRIEEEKADWVIHIHFIKYAFCILKKSKMYLLVTEINTTVIQTQ